MNPHKISKIFVYIIFFYYLCALNNYPAQRITLGTADPKNICVYQKKVVTLSRKLGPIRLTCLTCPTKT